MYDKQARKCRLCRWVNAGHDSRNFPKKHQYKTAQSTVSSAVSSAVCSTVLFPLPISLEKKALDDAEIMELDNLDIQVTFDQSRPTASFSESAFGPHRTVPTMRPDGHRGPWATAHAIPKRQDD